MPDSISIFSSEYWSCQDKIVGMNDAHLCFVLFWFLFFFLRMLKLEALCAFSSSLYLVMVGYGRYLNYWLNLRFSRWLLQWVGFKMDLFTLRFNLKIHNYSQFLILAHITGISHVLRNAKVKHIGHLQIFLIFI